MSQAPFCDRRGVRILANIAASADYLPRTPKNPHYGNDFHFGHLHPCHLIHVFSALASVFLEHGLQQQFLILLAENKPRVAFEVDVLQVCNYGGRSGVDSSNGHRCLRTAAMLCGIASIFLGISNIPPVPLESL